MVGDKNNCELWQLALTDGLNERFDYPALNCTMNSNQSGCKVNAEQ